MSPLEPARVLYEACGDVVGWVVDGRRMLRWRSLSSVVQRRLRAKADRRRAPPTTIEEARALLSSIGHYLDKPSQSGPRRITK